MSSRAELIDKLEAMRADVRSVVGESSEDALPTLTRAVDALTFVVIGMLEAQGPPVVVRVLRVDENDVILKVGNLPSVAVRAGDSISITQTTLVEP